MSKQPDLVVFSTPPYQPIANRAHEILQKAHDALAFLEIEAMDMHYAEDDALNEECDEPDLEDKEYDEWREKRNARIVHNTRMENLWRDLHNIVRKLESGLGAVEDYR
jgi:hypothetical protein